MADRVSSPEAALAAAGLAPDRAKALLRDAGLWGDSGPAAGVDALLDLVSEAASPEDALLVVTQIPRGRLEEIRGEPAWLERVVAVAGASRPLGDLLARHADALRALRDPGPVDPTAIAREVRDVVADAGAAGIAAIRRSATAAIAARDLTGAATVEEVATDLSRLAEGVLGGTLAALDADRDVAIVGMGKLGGEELNYVSDVDVIFVHTDDVDREEAQRACAELLGLLNASTTMGRAYEVDPTLRPEGPQGPLSRTVSSYVAYWERWAETWEFQALLKARPVAGAVATASELLAAAEDFVYPEHLDPGVVAEIHHMKGRVEGKAEVVRHGDRQLKLGPGGLRDIEFAVQLLQVVHGRADRSLRARGTLPALAALARGGYVAEDDAETFAAAYRELRDIEHRLQLADERRTHTLPDDERRLERLARSLGYRPTSEVPAREPFLARLRAVQGEVRDLHAKLFYRPLLDLHARVPATDAEVVQAGMDEAAALRRIEALGFRDAGAVLRDVRSLTQGVSRRATTLRAVLPAMLHALAESPDPDAGMRMLRTLIETHGPEAPLVASLRDQPPAADLLARLLGTSEVVGELLTSQPQGLEWLTDPGGRAEPRSRDELVRGALGQLRWQSGLDGQQAALRRFKRRELTRIVVRDLAGDASVSAVGEELAALGEACLEAGLAAVLEDGGVDGIRVALLGMGKLGGRELNYASDLDVVFVHDGDSDAAIEVAARLLDALSTVTAEGTAFEVDAELRPEGRSGPLSRSLDSFRTYYERWSQPWEHQALLKARRVAGDTELGRELLALTRELAYPEAFGERDVTAMRRMKARIEKERVPRRADASRHLKLGPGGLSDVEWTVQLLQQQHGHRHAELRTTSTMAAIDAGQDLGLLGSRDAQWLRDGYRFLAATRNRLYLLRQRDVDTLPSSAPVVEKLARSLGYGRGGRQAFEDDYLRHTRHVRRVVERVFYGRD